MASLGHIGLMWLLFLHSKLRCILTSDNTCGAPVLGDTKDTGTEWSDESCALIHGPVTGVRMWHTTNNRRIKLWVDISYFKCPQWLVSAAIISPVLASLHVCNKTCFLTQFTWYERFSISLIWTLTYSFTSFASLLCACHDLTLANDSHYHILMYKD